MGRGGGIYATAGAVVVEPSGTVIKNKAVGGNGGNGGPGGLNNFNFRELGGAANVAVLGKEAESGRLPRQ